MATPLDTLPYSITYIDPAPINGGIEIQMVAKINDSAEGYGVAWYYNLVNDDFYCFYILGKTGVPQDPLRYMQFELIKVVGGVVTILDTFTDTVSNKDYFGEFIIYGVPGELSVDFIDYDNGNALTTLVLSTDNELGAVVGDIGLLHGGPGTTENTNYFYIGSFVVYDYSMAGSKASLVGTATVTPTGELTTEYGEASLSASASVTAGASINDIEVDVTGYRFGEHTQTTAETNTWLAPLNTPAVVPANEPFRIRWLIKNNNAFPSAPFQAKVQLRTLDMFGVATPWVDADGGSSWNGLASLPYDATTRRFRAARIYSDNSFSFLYGDPVTFYEPDTGNILIHANVSDGHIFPRIFKVIGDSMDDRVDVTEVKWIADAYFCRSSTFCKCANGDVLLFTVNRNTEYASYVRSTDNGETWGDITAINTTTTITTSYKVGINVLVGASGKLWVFYYDQLITSSDHGITWDASWVDTSTNSNGTDGQSYIARGASDDDIALLKVTQTNVFSTTSLVGGSWITSTAISDIDAQGHLGGHNSGIVLIQPVLDSTYAYMIWPREPSSSGTEIISSFHVTIITRATGANLNYLATNIDDYNESLPQHTDYLPPTNTIAPYTKFALLDFNETTSVALIATYGYDIYQKREAGKHAMRLRVFSLTVTATPVFNGFVSDEYTIYTDNNRFVLGNATVVDNSYILFAIYDEDTSQESLRYSTLFRMPIHSFWHNQKVATTQKIGSGAFTASNSGRFVGPTYPAMYDNNEFVVTVDSGAELEIETTVCVPDKEFESNIEYQFRLVPADEYPIFKSDNTYYHDYLDDNNILPPEWVSPAPGATAGWHWGEKNARDDWGDLVRPDDFLVDTTTTNMVDIPNLLTNEEGVFAIGLDHGYTTTGNNTVYVDMLDSDGIPTNVWGAVAVSYLMFGLAFDMSPSISAIRLRHQSETDPVNTGILSSWALWFKFYRGRHGVNRTDSPEYTFNNIVHASFKKDVTSAALPCVATLTATATGASIVTGATELTAVAAFTGDGFVIGSVIGHFNHSGVATIVAAATKGITGSFDVDFHGVASVIASGTTARFELETFRWRNDDGDEATATWIADADVNPSLPLDKMHRVRMGIRNTSTIDDNQLGILHLEMSVNGGAWESADTIAGASSCCEPRFEVDKTLSVLADDEDYVKSPMLFEDSAGRWHIFYISRNIGVFDLTIKHRRSINKGVSWDEWSEIDHIQTDPAVMISGKMLEQSNGDLHFFHQTDSGNGIVVTTSTNGGLAWSTFELATIYTYGVIYWDVVVDSNDKMWLSFMMYSDSWYEWVISGTHVSTNGTDWATPEGLIRNDTTLDNRNGMVAYFEDGYSGIRADVIYKPATTYQLVERYKWDGVTHGTFPYEGAGVSWDTWESGYNKQQYYGFFIPTQAPVVGTNFPRINVYAPNSFGDGVRHLTSYNKVYSANDDFYPVHWDGVTAVNFSVAGSNGILSQNIYVNGEHILRNSSGSFGLTAHGSFVNYDGVLEWMFNTKLETNSSGHSGAGVPLAYHDITNKVYGCDTDLSSTDYSTIRMNHLNSPDLTGMGLWENLDHATQQITSGTFLTNNFGVSMLGTCGHVERLLPANTKFEMEFFVKLNSAVVAEGDTVCFRVTGIDSVPVGYPCLTRITENASLVATATVIATATTDGPKASLSAIATVTAVATKEVFGASDVTANAVVTAFASVEKTFKANIQAYAEIYPFAKCSKEAAISITARATIETLSQSTVKAKSSFLATAELIIAAPVVEVACKVSLLGVSIITPHGVRLVKAKTYLQAIAKIGALNRGISGTVDEQQICLNIYKVVDELEVSKEGDLIVVRNEESLTINKASDELIIVKKLEQEFQVVR